MVQYALLWRVLLRGSANVEEISDLFGVGCQIEVGVPSSLAGAPSTAAAKHRRLPYMEYETARKRDYRAARRSSGAQEADPQTPNPRSPE